jgi:hypothetical protein
MSNSDSIGAELNFKKIGLTYKHIITHSDMGEADDEKSVVKKLTSFFDLCTLHITHTGKYSRRTVHPYHSNYLELTLTQNLSRFFCRNEDSIPTLGPFPYLHKFCIPRIRSAKTAA